MRRVVTPRNVARPLELVGRTPLEEFQTTEEWIVDRTGIHERRIGGTTAGLRMVTDGTWEYVERVGGIASGERNAVLTILQPQPARAGCRRRRRALVPGRSRRP